MRPCLTAVMLSSGKLAHIWECMSELGRYTGCTSKPLVDA